jgi:hypothetical protein
MFMTCKPRFLNAVQRQSSPNHAFLNRVSIFLPQPGGIRHTRYTNSLESLPEKFPSAESISRHELVFNSGWSPNAKGVIQEMFGIDPRKCQIEFCEE